MRRMMLIAGWIALFTMLFGPVQAQAPRDPGQSGSYAVAELSVTVTNPNTGSQLATDIYFPSSSGLVDPNGAPYGALIFARGFQASSSSYSGNGKHLASWGYIVAIPNFPDEDLEVRASDVGYLFSYLEGENDNSASPFFQKIDTQRFALTGHSLGGVNTMMLAARDARVKMAGVALDPAGGPAVFGNSQWDYEAEAPEITAPLLVIGGQAGFCNSSAQYNAMYPAIGATHKAKFVIANGGHCDFMDTDEPLQTTLCSLLCGGQFSQEHLKLAERYSAAWFNYYLRLDTDYYTYLYGGKAEEDVQAGRITRDVQTAPRDVSARSRFRAVELNWTLYNHPIIAGYNIYRSEQSGHYSSTPYAQVGRASSYMDTNATPGQLYFYVLRSRDAAGNEHQPSVEVSAVAGAQAQHTIHLPLLFRSD